MILRIVFAAFLLIGNAYAIGAYGLHFVAEHHLPLCVSAVVLAFYVFSIALICDWAVYGGPRGWRKR